MKDGSVIYASPSGFVIMIVMSAKKRGIAVTDAPFFIFPLVD
ncbi:hypothetical protein [Bacillus benzoevorans]|uniref:Uncharacterized protein n=1 Tax=Bacillus benzoevorans TaxID=1456 RepID=A0A7X0HSK8_9BACI|nr:hypothetical protein [Bacillus benzoevorans]MBB6446089.1 hypothetical protein [Bacillus benzoevorans]